MIPLQFQLKQAVKLLEETKISYAVLGGVAVSIYGQPRLTFDIDINLILNEADIENFLKKAKKFGFTPLPPNIKKFIQDTAVIPMKFQKNKVLGRCDFIIAQNLLEYLCIKRAQLKKIYSTKVKLVTPEDLLLHKITSSRPRDLDDAQAILYRQGEKLDINYIAYWLKKIAKVNRKPALLTTFKGLLKQSKTV